MATKSIAESVEERDQSFLNQLEEYRIEMAAIRRQMKETDAEIRRLEKSTRQKLDHIKANLFHAEKHS